MPSKLYESVQRGAALLDKENPGWERKINLRKLDMADPELCIIGLLYGNYLVGLRSLKLYLGMSANLHGFGAAGNRLWRKVILERLGKGAK